MRALPWGLVYYRLVVGLITCVSGIRTRDPVKESKTRLRSNRSTSVLSHHHEWGSEIRLVFEIQKHLKSGLFEGRIRISSDWASRFQNPTSFGPFTIQTRLDFRSPLYITQNFGPSHAATLLQLSLSLLFCSFQKEICEHRVQRLLRGCLRWKKDSLLP